ncbi:MAG TPA: restriction endonuclease subunit S [Planctomycetota bacterium]|nr:restriction endonuclease subunit S [Planctomycetota bacterium]
MAPDCHQSHPSYSSHSAAEQHRQFDEPAKLEQAIKANLRGCDMAGEWRASTWGDEISLEYGKALRDYDESRGKFRVFGSNGPIGWTTEPLASGPGVILGRKGAYRGIQFCREPFFVIDTAYYVVPKTELDMRWLYYAIKYHKLGEIDDGSPIPSTTRSAVYVRDFDVPPLAEQKAIAAVLGALDDKIELNRRMNATLEAMARALFQSWFVDFDPVRAKLDGRKPMGMDKATAALFPDKFQDSPLSLIPHGWNATTLGEICDDGGGDIQTGPFGTQLHASDYVPEGVPSIMPSDLRDNRIDASSIARIREQDAERLSVYRVQAGDVVYSRRGDVERRALIRRAENGWLCGTGCLRVRFGSRGLNPHFGAAFLGTPESRAWVVRHAVGATMPNLNTSILSALPMIVPPAELQSRFAEIVGPWDELGTIALTQFRTLAALRDTLLPKLLSGEMSVNEGFIT